ncbi:MAG: Rrf2 family transcriptional regulator [Candidatus Omnitrophica bacterium]|nr:Rrf2 family transcriptional regulator [Candidatus Omnitrophota bacterium]MCM8824597.1 Rrf2 family transcriptional regulator [Candidatus Omnitrophota bacterium]
MFITTRVRYGIRGLIEIGTNSTPVLLKHISERQNLSLKYLDHILNDLRNKGFIIRTRAKKGGYILAKNPKDITLYDIIGALEGISKIECLQDSGLCPRVKICGARVVWSRLDDKISSVLKGITLEDFIKEQRKLDRQRKA